MFWRCVPVLFLVLLPLKAEEQPRPHIDPEGIKGTLVLSSGASDAALDRFFEAAGGTKANILVMTMPSADAVDRALATRLVERWTSKKATVTETAFSAECVPAIGKATGVWFCTTDPTRLRLGLPKTGIQKACEALLARRGAVGTSGVSVDVLSGFLPDSLVGVETVSLDALKQYPGSIGYAIGANAALVVRGRRLSVAGDGAVTIHLLESRSLAARKIVLQGKRVEDLTALRRSAVARSQKPVPLGDSVVKNGTLIIIGGGGMPQGLLARFVELAGGAKASIVVFPTAIPDPLPPRDGMAVALEKLGAKVTILKGRTQAAVESKEFLDTLRNATGIWFGGGRQWMFVDAYEGTKAHAEMFALLKRGGVIAGSSAGATIQGDYLCRGSPFDNTTMMYEGYDRGLCFLAGVGIDQHFTQRKRQADMTAFIKAHPGYLGIGIDEATAIIVKGSVAEVTGKGKVHFYDAARPVEKGKEDYEALAAGSRYDLKTRKTLPIPPK